MQVQAYHGVDASTHQQHVNDALAQGFRPVALDVSGDPGDARYAAVWTDEPGSGWAAVHGLDSGAYQAKFTELTGQGYAPMIVTATGGDGREIFAAVFELDQPLPWFARHNLRWDPVSDPDTIVHENGRAFDEGYIPRCLAVYGDPADRRYAGIWIKNTQAVLWSWWLTDQANYQRFFDALVAGGLRPGYVSVADDGAILSVFRGDQLVGGWAARHGIDPGAYQAEFDARALEGRRPIVVSAGGFGDGARYAAIFATDDTPISRVWTTTGPSFTGSVDLDTAVLDFMRRYGVRAGSVSIGRGGRIVGSRGYTWAEPDYPITTPDTRFRIASLSKMFAAAVVSEMVADGRLTWNTMAFAAAGINSALPSTASVDPAMNSITLQQIVLRLSRLPRDFAGNQRDIASTLDVGAAPISRDQLLRFLYGGPLQTVIPAGGLYSNAAFYLLTAVIEQVSGRSFVDQLNIDVLGPLGINDVSVGNTGVGQGQANEVISYDRAVVSPSLLDYSATALAPNAFGGDFVLETGAGAGALVSSTPSLARLVATYPVWNADATALTGRELATRYGTLDGTISGATCRADGLDFAFVFNLRVTDGQHDEINNAIHAVLNVNGAGL
ncbi:MAG: hypothetical protein JWM76_2522 [Pseudonocardiales bacterium]|nr:hypothetical protein [Pseudonocardiales bacterium]